MGFTMDDISSEERRSRQTCVTRVRQHTPEMTDFVSYFEPQSLAVDAATMLEAFRSYALRAVPHRQGAGCGLEAAAGRVQGGQVALRPG